MLDWTQLALLSNEELTTRDVAETHLACAAGLPGSEKIDVQVCLNKLNYCARRVGQFTERNLPRFRRKRYDYNNSEAYFRALCLITVLQRDLRILYNPDKIPEDAPFDTADTFIHGAILGPGGTCATLPVVYAAVGRRLGYPLKLVGALKHLLVRWEAGKDRFNIEASGPGMHCPPDDYFRTGRYEVSPEEERLGCLLRSMTPREELACFLMGRGYCWLDVGNFREATRAFAWGCALQPENRHKMKRLARTLDEWRERLAGLAPEGFPETIFDWPPRCFPPTLDEGLEKDLLCLTAVEDLLQDPELEGKWWEPMRRGYPPVRRPSQAFFRYTPGYRHMSFRFRVELTSQITVGANHV